MSGSVHGRECQMLRPNPTKQGARASALAWASVLLLIASISPAMRGQAPAAPRIPFTQAQSMAGGRLYAQRCASCHGGGLADGGAPPLSRARVLSTWTAPGRTLDDLFFIIQSTMPKNEGGTLSSAEYASVLAYILERNGYSASDRELTPDRATLSALRLTPATGTSQDKKGPPPDFIAGTGGTAPHASGPKHEDLVAATEHSRDWLLHTHDYSGTRYSPLSQITTTNVSRLHAVCAYQVGETGNFQTGPIVDRGTMYLTSPLATIALDASTCRPKWRYVW